MICRRADSDMLSAAKAFFDVTVAFRIGRIEEAARSIATTDYYESMALARALDTIAAARRGIAIEALDSHGRSQEPVRAWLEAGSQRIDRTRERLQALTESGEITVSRLSVAAGLMSDLTGA
jgi:glutamate dehydrogenase